MSQDEAPGKTQREFLPLLDFSTLVLPFYTQGLVSLGLMEDPVRKVTRENLPLAQRLIDILQLLKARTRGNLQPEEEELLESCLHQMRTAYLRKTQALQS
ncbi:MAG: DUF1844 domain-containing protein [Candidatus Aminicenantes bacterium]|nr:DUF1844 domain-containing protein [Candidatus Aminicenantes bacterium]